MIFTAVAMSLVGMDESHYVRKQDKSYRSEFAHWDSANNGIQWIDRARGETQLREQLVFSVPPFCIPYTGKRALREGSR